MRLRSLVLVCCLLAPALLAACSADEPPARAKKPPERTLVIGLIPEVNIFQQMERYGPLSAYLSKKTGVRYQLKVLPRYGNVVKNFRSLGLDGAFFGSFSYTLAHSRVGLKVIARPENLEGVSTYHGMVFVRKDSGIRTVRDMKGKRLACVSKATTAGYLLPNVYFQENGIPDPRKYLKEVYFAGSHQAVIQDVLMGQADIGAAKNTVLDRMASRDPTIRGLLRVIAVSPDVPENALALRAEIDEDLAGKIKKALLSMDRDPEGREILRGFGARRFVETVEQDYEPVLHYAKHLNIDLATFDNLNK